MTLESAFKHLMATESFKGDARTNSTLRVYAKRFEKGKLSEKSMEILLIKYGYDIHKIVKKPTKGI